jgi:hypothetical protein
MKSFHVIDVDNTIYACIGNTLPVFDMNLKIKPSLFLITSKDTSKLVFNLKSCSNKYYIDSDTSNNSYSFNFPLDDNIDDNYFINRNIDAIIHTPSNVNIKSISGQKLLFGMLLPKSIIVGSYTPLLEQICSSRDNYLRLNDFLKE